MLIISRLMQFKQKYVEFRMVSYKDTEQPAYLETFHSGPEVIHRSEMEPIDYIIPQLDVLVEGWKKAIGKFESVLVTFVCLSDPQQEFHIPFEQFTDSPYQNRLVLEGSSHEIDRELVRKLYKLSQILAEIRRVHSQQFEALQSIVNDGQNGLWFTAGKRPGKAGQQLSEITNDPSAVQAPRKNERFSIVVRLLKSLKKIGHKIEVDLVAESTALIDKVVPNSLVYVCANRL